MRKYKCLPFILLLILLLTSCYGENQQGLQTKKAVSIEDISEEIDEQRGNNSLEKTVSQKEPDTDEDFDVETEIQNNQSSDVDIDLTDVSSTIAYTQLFVIQRKPDEYIGKTVKLNGEFQVIENTENNIKFFAIIVSDDAACCKVGYEIVFSEKYKQSTDFPQIGENVTLVGKVNGFEKDGLTYINLIEVEIV